MSRVAPRRRWVMTGPWPHPKTRILYFRKATPPDIFAERERLAERGIKVTREIQRSLGTRDRKPAERAYKQISEAVDAEWDRWRQVLREEPDALKPKQEAASAEIRVNALPATHYDAATPLPPLADGQDDADDAISETLSKMTGNERKSLERDLNAFRSAKSNLKTKIAFRLLKTYPLLKQALGPDWPRFWNKCTARISMQH